MPHNPLTWLPTRPLAVRQVPWPRPRDNSGHGWMVSCSDCWANAVSDSWEHAMRLANGHVRAHRTALRIAQQRQRREWS